MRLSDRLSLLLLLAGMTIFNASVEAQEWAVARLVSGFDNEWVTHLSSSEEYVVVAGSFRGHVKIGSETLESTGGFDIFLAWYKPDGELIRVRQLKGPESDFPTALVATPDGEVWSGGTYTDFIVIGDSMFTPDFGSSGAFVVRWNTEGVPVDVTQCSGTGLEQITGIAPLSGGGFALGGYMSESCLLADTVIVATSNPAAFLSVHDSSGTVQRVHVIGDAGTVRATALTVLSDGSQLALAGNYQGTVSFAGDTLTAAASGTDIFLASMDAHGTPLWMTGAKGAWDDQAVALATDEAGTFYLTGYLVGNLTFSNQIPLQSADFQEDIFLARYHRNGSPIWALALQDPGEETGEALAIGGGKVYLVGHYSESLTIGGQTAISPSGMVQSVCVVLDTAGQFENLIPLHSNELSLAAAVTVLPGGQPAIGGGFSGSLTLPPEQLEALGGFDAYWAVWDEQTTSLHSPISLPPKLLTPWPNPSTTAINIEWPERPVLWLLVNQSGHIFPLCGPLSDRIEVSHLPTGMYDLITTGPSGKRYLARFSVLAH